MSDLISRERAISELVNMVTDHYKDEPFHGLMLHWTEIKAMLESLPSAEPERKKGKWIIDRHGNWACDQCGNDPYHCNMENMNFCPNCGADMRGEKGR